MSVTDLRGAPGPERVPHPEEPTQPGPDRSCTIDITGHRSRVLRGIEAAPYLDERSWT